LAFAIWTYCISNVGDSDVLKKILILSFLLGSGAAYAQVAPSVQGGNSTLWVGGEFSSFDSDYDTSKRLLGLGALVDFNLTPRFGLEAEGRWMKWNAVGQQSQYDYLLGAKARLFHYHRFSANAKFLVGGVWITYPLGVGSGSYFAYVPGGYGEYRISRKFAVRGDYEYQFLPTAPGFPGQPSHGLNPNGFSVGVTYRILGVR
jgi:hypothetical protein